MRLIEIDNCDKWCGACTWCHDNTDDPNPRCGYSCDLFHQRLTNDLRCKDYLEAELAYWRMMPA